jgi:hypothetical protein
MKKWTGSGKSMIGNWARGAVVMRMLYALAILMLGFSGGAQALPNLEPYGAEYKLPDGTFATLCMPSEEKGAPHGDHKHCDMCVMAAGHLFTTPETAFVTAPVSHQSETVRAVAIANLKRIVSHHGLSRGPPLSA